VDVFGTAVAAGGDFLRDAAIAAGHELGVFAALERMTAAASHDELARACDVSAGKHRLRALVDVLAALGAIERRGDRFAAGTPPPRREVPQSGWGLLASVIRTDRPLPLDGGGAERRMHRHLATAGAQAARELAPVLAGSSLLDLGGGAGAYTAAFLAAHADATATLVDTAEVVAIAREELARFGDRARFAAGDARTAIPEGAYDTALLCNLLHLHSFETSLELCRAAIAAVAPGGMVAIKDLRLEPSREGPLTGLLFALNMALYTEAGDVHDVDALVAMLHAVGAVDIAVGTIAAAPDAVVVTGRRPRAWDHDAGAIDRELDAALAATAAALPAALRRFLVRALAEERATPGPEAAQRASALVRHYTELMPRMRIAQLAPDAAPEAAVLAARLDWTRLPRLSGAIDRLFALLRDHGVAAEPALGAPTADALRARSPTLGALYERTHYGGCMPLLYGTDGDLAYFARRAAEDGDDVHALVDRFLTTPIVHELAHFGRDRAALSPPHLDECVAGWLGVHVHPAFAYPGDADDDAIFAAPWLAQIGQAIARAFGIAPIVRAHAGAAPWDAVVPRPFVVAAARFGWADWCARRTLHFLSDTLDPAPWVALALAAGARRSLAGETLTSLARRPLADLAGALPDDPDFDRAIVADALRAMCLANRREGGSFRTRTVLPDAPIEIDAGAATVTTAKRGDVDVVAPRYWLPPAIAARIRAAGFGGYALRLGAIDAIAEAAAAICAAGPAVERPGFALAPRSALR
jgi:hypothetical protein